MGANEKQSQIEEQIIERLLVEGQEPGDVLRELLAGPDAPDPLEAVFALATVASDMADWHEAGLHKLADQCFDDALLFICELWVQGYRLKRPDWQRPAGAPAHETASDETAPATARRDPRMQMLLRAVE